MDLGQIEEMVAEYYQKNFDKYGEVTLEAFEEMILTTSQLEVMNEVLYQINADLVIKNAELERQVASFESFCAICNAAGRPG